MDEPPKSHRPRLRPSAVLLTALLLTLGVLCGCQGGTRVDGIVVLSDGSPVEGAEVTFDIPDDSRSSSDYATTNAKGQFHVAKSHAPVKVRVRLSVRKHGFVAHDETFEGEPHDLTRRIVLTPVEDEPS